MIIPSPGFIEGDPAGSFLEKDYHSVLGWPGVRGSGIAWVEAGHHRGDGCGLAY